MIGRQGHHGLRLIVGLTVTCASGWASGSGFYIGDVGTRGLARGGAFVAAPDSLLAASYNPAGLAQLRGFHFELSLAYVELRADIDRRCPCLDPETDANLASTFQRSSTSTPLAIPYVGIGYGFDWLNTHVAFAAWGPNSGRHDWGEIPDTSLGSERFARQSLAQSQRYSAFKVENFEANFTLNLAMEPVEGLRLGVTGYLHYSGSNQSVSVWANSATFAGPAENTDFDVPLEVDLDPSPGLGWGVGASYEIVSGLSIGTSFRSQRTVRDTGSLAAQLPVFFLRNFPDSRIEGDAVDIDFEIAPIWRGGVEYRMPGVFRVEAAVVWEGWSVHDEIIVSPQNVQVIVPLANEPIVVPEIVLPRDWNDTWSFRLGGEVHVLQPYVDLRWGYFYENSAVPEATVAASRIDRPKHGVSLGAAVTWRGITLEVAATYVHLLPISIDDSAIRVTGVFPTEPDESGAAPFGSIDNLSVVGNGDVTGNYLMGAVSLGFRSRRLSVRLAPRPFGANGLRGPRMLARRQGRQAIDFGQGGPRPASAGLRYRCRAKERRARFGQRGVDEHAAAHFEAGGLGDPRHHGDVPVLMRGQVVMHRRRAHDVVVVRVSEAEVDPSQDAAQRGCEAGQLVGGHREKAAAVVTRNDPDVKR